MRGVLIGSYSILSSFEISASQSRPSSGGPSTGGASCSCGTCPFIRQASPSADVDRSYHVSMAYPATVRTDIGSVLCFVSGTTGRTFLGRIGRVHLLDFDPKTLRFVGDEQRELVEAPGILHPVVFASFRSTTCTCRALAYSCKRLYLDGSHPLLMGVVDNLARELMVDLLHPTRFFALAFPDGAGFLGLL